MSERFLVDTSTRIEALHPHGNPAARAWVDEALGNERVVLAAPILAELLAGARTEQEYEDLAAGFKALALLPIAHAEWEETARASFDLRRLGLTTGPLGLRVMRVPGGLRRDPAG